MDDEPTWLEAWNGDGVITRCPRTPFSDQKAAQGIPVVNMFEEIISKNHLGHVIESDHLAVGKMAAEFLLGSGCQHFAFIGYTDSVFSKGREHSFEHRLKQAGHSCATFLTPDHNISDQARWVRRQKKFIEDLPKPCALYCATDELAVAACNDCLSLGVSIPEQVLILGTDNDPFFCEMMSPKLSSIDLDIPQVGWQLATWLDVLIRGGDPEEEGVSAVIAPKGVVARQSTEYLGGDDPYVAKALEAIRLTACQGATVDDIVAVCNTSRRSLERRFLLQFGKGRSLKSFLIQTQLDRAKKLLVETDYTLAHIAELIGMQYTERLSHMFKRETGVTPGQYRKQVEGG
jgi:LacI family transcriptional regulator